MLPPTCNKTRASTPGATDPHWINMTISCMSSMGLKEGGGRAGGEEPGLRPSWGSWGAAAVAGAKPLFSAALPPSPLPARYTLVIVVESSFSTQVLGPVG